MQNIPGILALPASVATRLDVSRLVTEVEQVDSDLSAREARIKAGAEAGAEPKYSEHLNDFLAANHIEMGSREDRSRLIKHLRHLKATAPVIHLTFASVPDNKSLQQIVEWIRQSIHVHASVNIGLQPSLVGGVYVRTPNHVHDFSIRARLAGHRNLIIEEVEALSGK